MDGFFSFNLAALNLAWRAHFCASAAYFNVSIPPTNVDSYVMRRLSFERICKIPRPLPKRPSFLTAATPTCCAKISDDAPLQCC